MKTDKEIEKIINSLKNNNEKVIPELNYSDLVNRAEAEDQKIRDKKSLRNKIVILSAFLIINTTVFIIDQVNISQTYSEEKLISYLSKSFQLDYMIGQVK